jgi:hypothetical protein
MKLYAPFNTEFWSENFYELIENKQNTSKQSFR